MHGTLMAGRRCTTLRRTAIPTFCGCWPHAVRTWKPPTRTATVHCTSRARDGHADACELLIGAGADANARIDVGMTAADLAERFPDLQVWLLSHQSR